MTNNDFSTKILVNFKIEDIAMLEGELRTVLAPRTIERVSANFPISSRIHLWKNEVYFDIGVKMGAEKSKSHCEAGEIAYWPQGDAICIFFEAMTPISKVNPIGRLTQPDFNKVFAMLRSGMMIQMDQRGE